MRPEIVIVAIGFDEIAFSEKHQKAFLGKIGQDRLDCLPLLNTEEWIGRSVVWIRYRLARPRVRGRWGGCDGCDDRCDDRRDGRRVAARHRTGSRTIHGAPEQRRQRSKLWL